MLEVVSAFGFLEELADLAAEVPQAFDGPSRLRPDQSFEFREHGLDGIQIGAVRRQVSDRGPARFDRFPDACPLVRALVVHHHDVAGPQGRHEVLDDPTLEERAVDRPVDHQRCRQS